MKTVQDLLDENNRELIKIDPNQTVFEALTMLSKYDIGALVVMNGEILSGIFSERDYARKVILSGKSSKETFVKEIMTEKVKCISPQNNIEDCIENVDVTIILTEWSEFRTLSANYLSKFMKGNVVVDFRNALNPENFRNKKFTLYQVGRGPFN